MVKHILISCKTAASIVPVRYNSPCQGTLPTQMIRKLGKLEIGELKRSDVQYPVKTIEFQTDAACDISHKTTELCWPGTNEYDQICNTLILFTYF